MRTCEERTRDVLERRDAYRQKQQRQQSAVAFGILCGALILSICLGTLPRLNKPAVESYDAVFEAVKANGYDYVISDDGEIYLEYAEDTGTATPNMGRPGVTRPTAATQATTSTGTSSEHSDTNLQVAGVDEADIVKTDGRHLYVLSGERIVIVDPNDGQPQKLAEFTPSHGEASGYGVSGMYLVGDRLVVMQRRYMQLHTITAALVYDIADPEKPSLVTFFEQDGCEISSRVIGDVLYTVSQHTIRKEPDQNEPATFVPSIGCDEKSTVLAANDIYICEESAQYVVVTAVRVSDKGERLSQKAVLTAGDTVYANMENLYVAGGFYNGKTKLVRFALNDGKIEQQAQTEIEGTLLNQFAMDEYDGYLRVVVTEYGAGGTTNALLVLDKDLNTVGSLTGLAEDERVYSVRFDGTIGYFVTFRQVDPLFTVDLRDPTKPMIQSELKIPGFSQYLHPYGDGLLLGIGRDADEYGRAGNLKLSMFDVSDPTAVNESAVRILEQSYGEVLHNHKAVLIDVRKNLIGFATDDSTYHIYGYDAENGFLLKAQVAAFDGANTRGVYLDQYLYVASAKGVLAYRMSDFGCVGALSIVQEQEEKPTGTVRTSTVDFS